MSVKIMGMVFDRYPNGGGEMLLALALADHADHDGGSIFPSVANLALKTRQSERSVQYQLRSMENSGWLVLVANEYGGRSKAREYKISPEWTKGAEIAPIAKGCKTQQKRVQNTTEKGATAIAPEPSLTVIEPSIIVAPKKRATQYPADFYPNQDAIDYLVANKIDPTRELEQFRDSHLAKGSEFKDWQAAFRTWARNAIKWQQNKSKTQDARLGVVQQITGGARNGTGDKVLRTIPGNADGNGAKGFPAVA